MDKSREQDKMENNRFEYMDWKQRTVIAHPAWLKILFKIWTYNVSQDEGCLSSHKHLSTFLVGREAFPKTHRGAAALHATPGRLRGTARCLSAHEGNRLKGPTEFSRVKKMKVMHPRWPRGNVGKWFEILSSVFLLQRGFFLDSPLGPSKLSFNKSANEQAVHVFCFHIQK